MDTKALRRSYMFSETNLHSRERESMSAMKRSRLQGSTKSPLITSLLRATGTIGHRHGVITTRGKVMLMAVIGLASLGLSACSVITGPIFGGTTTNATITNGVRWDTNGNLIDAHDGNIYQFDFDGTNAYYWYGTSYNCGFEWGASGSPFCGFKEYSSTDLTNWSPVTTTFADGKPNPNGLMFDPNGNGNEWVCLKSTCQGTYDGTSVSIPQNQRCPDPGVWGANDGCGWGSYPIQNFCSLPSAADYSGEGCFDVSVVYDSASGKYVAWFNSANSIYAGYYGVTTSGSPTGPWSNPEFIPLPLTPSTFSCPSDPVVTTDPVNTTAASGSITSLRSFAEGNPAPKVQWQEYINGIWQDIKDGLQSDGSYLTGAATDVLSILGVKTDQSGKLFRAVYSAPSGSVTTDPATLTVGTPTSTISVTQNPESIVTAAVGYNASFSAGASGTPTPSVQWQVSTDGGYSWEDLENGEQADGSITPLGVDTNIVSEVNTDNLTIKKVNGYDSGLQYRAFFYNSDTNTYSNPATLIVTPIGGGAASIYTPPSSSQSYLVFELPACHYRTVIWPLNSTDTNLVGSSPSIILNDATSAGPLYTGAVTISDSSLSSSPIITEPSNVNVTVAPNSEATFFAAANGSYTSVQWQEYTGGSWPDVTEGLQPDGSYISESNYSTTATLTISDPQTGESGYEYRAVFSNSSSTVCPSSSGTSTVCSSPAKLTVSINPSFKIATSPPSTIMATATNNVIPHVTIFASAYGMPMSAVNWQVRDPKNTENANNLPGSSWGAWQYNPSPPAGTSNWSWSTSTVSTPAYLADGQNQPDGSTISGASTSTLSVTNAVPNVQYRAVFRIPPPSIGYNGAFSPPPMGAEVPFIFSNNVNGSTYNYLISGYPECAYCGASTIFDWQSPAMGTSENANSTICPNVTPSPATVNPLIPCTWFVNTKTTTPYTDANNNILSATSNPCDSLGNGGQITGLAQLTGASQPIFIAMVDRWAGNPYAQAAADWPDLAVEQNQTRAESEWVPLSFNSSTGNSPIGQMVPWTSTNPLTCNSNGTSTFSLDLQDYTPTKSTPPTGSTYVPFSSPQDLQSFTLSGYNKYNKSWSCASSITSITTANDCANITIAGTTIDKQSVSPDATALVFALDVKNLSDDPGWVTVLPKDYGAPDYTIVNNTSDVNFAPNSPTTEDPNDSVSTSVNEKLSNGGMTVFNNSVGNISVTLVPEGYYEPSASGGSYYTPLSAFPLLWSGSVSTTAQQIPAAGKAGIPSSGTAVALGVQCANASANGWLSVSGTTQTNIPEEIKCIAGETRTELAYSSASSGNIELSSTLSANVRIWVEGYFSSSGDVFYPMNPVRVRSMSSIYSTNDCSSTTPGFPSEGTDVDPLICDNTNQFLPFGEGAVADVEIVAISKESTTGGWLGLGQSLENLGTSTPVMPLVDYTSINTAAGNDNEVLVPNNGSGKEGTYDNGPGSTMGLVLVRNNNPGQGAVSYAIDMNGWFDPSS